jgi:hypothetical protein
MFPRMLPRITCVQLSVTDAVRSRLLDLRGQYVRIRKVVRLSTHFCLLRVSDAGAMGGSEGAMPERANSLASGFIARTLAAAALLCLNTTASSAAECQERTAEPGHWYYHWDLTLHRQCWFLVPAEATTETPVSAPPAVMVGDDSRKSHPNTIPDRSGEATQSASPEPARRNKTVRRERPQIAPPATTGAADRHDQPKQSVRDEKQVSPFNEADRESLFQDFVRWQLDRNLFGHP